MVHPHEEFKEEDLSPKPMLREADQLMQWWVDHMAKVLGWTLATDLMSEAIFELHDQVWEMQEKLQGCEDWYEEVQEDPCCNYEEGRGSSLIPIHGSNAVFNFCFFFFWMIGMR